jgi:hypothetical protein
MDPNEESSIDIDNRYRKFGLPNWMVNNIERLNFVTDFEQYACSPPEAESFLTEHMDNCDFHEDSSLPLVLTSEPLDEKPKIPTEQRRISISKSSPNLLANTTEQIGNLSIIDNLKHEDMYYSSPDSTPCATPEPSPAPRRKMSGQHDTVQTNPGRWFYLGNVKKPDQNAKGQSLSVISNKENRVKCIEKSSDIPHKLRDSPLKSKKKGIKLVISNFDINAISPSSW